LYKRQKHRPAINSTVLRYPHKTSTLRSNRNISALKDGTLKSAEIINFWQSQSVDNQCLFFCQNVTSFTGKEKDSETGFYYFGARYYDPSMSGLFISVDPMADKYPSISPYAYCAWNPVKLVDPEGKVIRPAPGSSSAYINHLTKAMSYLKNNGAGAILNQLDNLPIIIYVSEISYQDAQIGKTRTNTPELTIYWCPNAALYTTNDVILSPSTVLNHEFDHMLQGIINPYTKAQDKQESDMQYDNLEERRVITGSEQETAIMLGEINLWQKTREDHNGGTCWVESLDLSEVTIPYKITYPIVFTTNSTFIVKPKTDTE